MTDDQISISGKIAPEAFTKILHKINKTMMETRTDLVPAATADGAAAKAGAATMDLALAASTFRWVLDHAANNRAEDDGVVTVGSRVFSRFVVSCGFKLVHINPHQLWIQNGHVSLAAQSAFSHLGIARPLEWIAVCAKGHQHLS
jgi:hypothetical protein